MARMQNLIVNLTLFRLRIIRDAVKSPIQFMFQRRYEYIFKTNLHRLASSENYRSTTTSQVICLCYASEHEINLILSSQQRAL